MSCPIPTGQLARFSWTRCPLGVDENIRDNYITRVQQSGQAAVNQPYGWSATGKPETEPVGKTLTSKPSGLS